MAEYVERGEVAGVVTAIARHGETWVDAMGVRDLASGSPMTPDTIFRVASMTKPVTAVAAMILVEECVLRLDDAVDDWLPELADRKVLRTIESDLDDTVPARRPITLRDVLTFRLGYGAVMAPAGAYPIQAAMAAAGVDPGPIPTSHPPDAWMRSLGALPLQHQPGEAWRYHTGSDVLGVLIARATGISLGAFLHERIFAPLGMDDTAFFVPDGAIDRLATCYRYDGKLAVADPARDGHWSRPPAFESGGGGLVATAADFLAFGRMLLAGGRSGAGRLLARPTVELMTTDQITPQQKAVSWFGDTFWETDGWGFGMAVITNRTQIGPSVGSFGWVGGFTTQWFVDPREDLVAILLSQRQMASAQPDRFQRDFWTLTYAAIDD